MATKAEAISRLPEELRDSIESTIRIATKHDFLIVGAFLRKKPLLVSTMSNHKGNPLEVTDLMHKFADYIEEQSTTTAPIELQVRQLT